MQTLILVHCTSGPSLRQQIEKALQKSEVADRYRLAILKQQKPGRNPGWTSVTPCDRAVRGALKLGWDGHSATLICRLISKGSDQPPNELAGLWLRYLFAEHADRIHTLLIIPRCSHGATSKEGEAQATFATGACPAPVAGPPQAVRSKDHPLCT
ncbi:MAG: hypothetical protein KatS3mg132_845 [Limisphaera sp.]|nr:MAG: hypothetical protein KatS3mg132_845 [Limisphaera sp.]